MGQPDLSRRTAVVTGASRGIGACLAREFAAQGVRLGLCARTAPVLAEGPSVVAEGLDVRDESAVESFAARVEERFGEMDLWINNAGVLAPISPVRDLSLAEFREHIDINLSGVLIGSRAYVRHVRRRRHCGGAVLINISSGAAWQGYAGWGAYCAGKAGVERLTECIALEEAACGLRAHAVAPGVVDTEMQALIRSCEPERFPEVERFREMKRSGELNSGSYVAREILALAFDPARATNEVAIALEPERSPKPG